MGKEARSKGQQGRIVEPKAIFQQADWFNEAARVLYLASNTRPNLFFPNTVVAAFALELYLKCLHVIRERPIPHTHDLKALFDRLHADDRQAIQRCSEPGLSKALKRIAAAAAADNPNNPPPPSNFHEALQLSALAFIRFRYEFQDHGGTDWIRHGWYGAEIVKCARHRILEIRPDLAKVT
jgi:HEPN domain-containing protein